MSKSQIALDEKKVIEQIQTNSNESIDTIGKRCGFSRQKVWRIIKRLENNKTIWGYRAVVNNGDLQMKKYILLVKKSNKPLSDLVTLIISRELEKKGKDIGVTIESSGYLHGSYDWMITFIADDIRQAKRFVDVFHRLFPQSVTDSELLEEIFPVKSCGVNNPNVAQLKEFV